MLTGYEQVRSIVADIAGDHAAAARVELVLPETGVCSAAPAALSSSCSAAASAAPGECGAPVAAAKPAKGGCCG
jgi:hypothetical protein